MECCVSKVDVMDGVMDGVKEGINGRSKGLPWPTPYVMFAFEKCYEELERRKEKKERDVRNGGMI